MKTSNNMIVGTRSAEQSMNQDKAAFDAFIKKCHLLRKEVNLLLLEVIHVEK